ncbi:MAG: histidine phosphatase family protein [Cyanobacteriota bacterium]|nr:histidine phosphatase family protein [Cyanobacteriota bacterium]
MREKPLRVVIVRHGESTFNIEKRIQGRSDQAVLTNHGQTQAQAVAQALAPLPIHLAFSSPLQRAQRTAQIILAERDGIPFVSTDLLREIDLTAWEGLTFAEVKQKFPEDHQRWRYHPHLLSLHQRYPVVDLWQQAQDFWTYLGQEMEKISPNGDEESDPSPMTILVVGHSGINRALIGASTGIHCQHYHRFGQDNCALSILNFPHGLNHPAQLESLNLTHHLGDPLPQSKGGLRLLLVRHGETQWNREQRFQGQKDIPLNATGEEQAQQVGAFLASQSIDLAFSSPLLRPWATAMAICQQHASQLGSPLDLVPLPDLQEICHGEWEGKLQREIEAEYPGLLEQWQQAPATVDMPCGENLQQVWQRAQQAWNTILEKSAQTLANPSAESPHLTTLVVAHDAINKAILCQLFDRSPEAFWLFKQGNGAVTVIDYPEGAEGFPVLRCLNITSHLTGGVLDSTAAGAL